MVDRRSAHSLCQMTAWGKSTEQHEAHRTRGCMRAQPLSYILLRQTWLALRNFIFTSLRKSNIAGARQRARADLCLTQSITMTMVSNSCVNCATIEIILKSILMPIVKIHQSTCVESEPNYLVSADWTLLGGRHWHCTRCSSNSGPVLTMEVSCGRFHLRYSWEEEALQTKEKPNEDQQVKL